MTIKLFPSCTDANWSLKMGKSWANSGSGGSRFEPWPASQKTPVQNRRSPWKWVSIEASPSSLTMTRTRRLV